MKQSKRKRKANDEVAIDVAMESETAAAPAPADAVVTQTLATRHSASLALGTSCTMREAAALKNELMKVLHEPQQVVVDVSAVERIDTAALQLLCAFVRDRRVKRLSTRFIGAPTAFADAVHVLGLTQALHYAPDARAA